MKTTAVHGNAMLTMSAVLYLGASFAKKMLDATRPIEFRQANSTPVVNARALRFGMFATVQAENMMLMGYACLRVTRQLGGARAGIRSTHAGGAKEYGHIGNAHLAFGVDAKQDRITNHAEHKRNGHVEAALPEVVR